MKERGEMNKVALFDTAIGTSNVGDEIIMSSCLSALKPLLHRSLCIRFGTHIQNYPIWQAFRNMKYDIANSCDYKFILGTNLVAGNLLKRIPQWNINLFSAKLYKNSILMGAGTTFEAPNHITLYTKTIYRKILSHKFYHSVRDEFTKEQLEKIGVQCLNTGCPTLWMFSPEKCRNIPQQKANRVIFTVSGYKEQMNPVKDQVMLDILQSAYDEFYFFAQTWVDEKYLNTLSFQKKVKKIYSLEQYSQVLQQGDIDYVGTRLHGGIFALQNDVRSVIISIDNRARGFHLTNNIPILERNDIEDLYQMINGKIVTNIIQQKDNIGKFLGQFMSEDEVRFN